MKKCELKGLQSGIKSLVVESRAFNLKIQATEGMTRHGWRVEKKDLGCFTRAKLLAYGFLRGIPYRVLERKSESPIPFGMVLTEVIEHGFCSTQSESIINQASADIEKWLAVEPEDVSVTVEASVAAE